MALTEEQQRKLDELNSGLGGFEEVTLTDEQQSALDELNSNLLSEEDDVKKKEDSEESDTITGGLGTPTTSLSFTQNDIPELSGGQQDELGNLESLGNTVKNGALQVAKSIPNIEFNLSNIQQKITEGAVNLMQSTEGIPVVEDITKFLAAGAALNSATYGSNVSGLSLALIEGEDISAEDVFGTTNIKEQRNNSIKLISKINENMGATKSLTGSIAQGDVAGTAVALVDAAGSFASSAAVAYTTFGVGTFSDMTANSIIDYNEVLAEEKGKSLTQLFDDNEQELLVPSVIGLAAGALEKVGLEGTGKVVKEAIKKVGTKNLKKYLFEPTKEGGTEWIQGGLESLNVSLAGGNSVSQATVDMFDAMFSEEGLEAFAKGAAGSIIPIAGADVLGRGKRKSGKISDLVKGTEATNQAKELETINEQIRTELDNTSLTPEVRKSLTTVLQDNNVSLVQLFEEDRNLQSNFTEEQKTEIESLSKTIQERNVLLQDENISPELKTSIEKSIEESESKVQNIVNQAKNQEVTAKDNNTINSQKKPENKDFDKTVFDSGLQQHFTQDIDTETELGDELNNAVSELDEGVKSLPEETVNPNDIVPTQKGIKTESLERAKDNNELPVLIKKDGKYYIEDGHHRVVSKIIEGEEIKANILDLDALSGEKELDGKKIKVFRGVGKNFAKGKNEGFTWVSEDKEVADEYAGTKEDGSLNTEEREIEEPKSIFRLPYKNPNQQVTSENIANLFRKEMTKKIKAKELSKEQWQSIKEKIKDYELAAGDNIEMFHTKLNKPSATGLASEILRDLGFDAVSIVEDGKNTYGLIPSIKKTKQDIEKESKDKVLNFFDKAIDGLDTDTKLTSGLDPNKIIKLGLQAARAVYVVSKDIAKAIEAGVKFIRDSKEFKNLNKEEQDIIIDEFNKSAKDIEKDTKSKKVDKSKEEERTPSGIKVALLPDDIRENIRKDAATEAEIIEAGKVIFEKGKIDPRDLVAEILGNNRAPQPEEVVLLVYHKTKLDNDLTDAYADKVRLTEDGKSTKAVDNKISRLEQDRAEYFHVSAITGSQQSLAFRLRKLLLNREYNAVTEINRYKSKNEGKIPEDIKKKFEDLEKELVDVKKRLDETEAKLKKEEEEQAVKNLIEETNKSDEKKSKSKKTSKKDSKKETKEDVDEDDEVGEISVSESGKLYIPKDLLKKLIREGATTIDELVAGVKSEMGDKFGDKTDREIRDVITGYGKTASLSQEEVDVELRKMKRLGKLMSALEDVKNKKRPLKSGLQRDELSDEERRLKEQIKELSKELPAELVDEEKAWKSAVSSLKTRLRNQIKDLQEQIKTGDRPSKKKGVEFDSEAIALEEQRDYLKKVLKKLDDESGLTNKQRVEKAIDAMEKSTTEYERRIREKDFTPISKPIAVEETPELIEARRRRDEIINTYKKLRDEEIGEKLKEEKRINNLRKKIADVLNGVSKEKREALEDSPEVKALKEELREAREKMGLVPPKPKHKTAEEKAIEAALNRLNKKVLEVEQKLKDNAFDVEVKKRKELTDSRVVEAKKRLKFANSIMSEMREKEGVADKIRLERTKESAKKRIAELKEKIKNKDFAPKKKAKPVDEDSDLVKLKSEKLRLQEEFEAEHYKNELANRTSKDKFFDGVREALNLPRALIASLDLSAVGVQGFKRSITRPKQGIHAFKRMWKMAGSADYEAQWINHVKSQEWYSEMNASGIFISEHDVKMNLREEQFISGWVNHLWNAIGMPIEKAFKSPKGYQAWVKANPYLAAERAYRGFLNSLRVQGYLEGKQHLENLGITYEANPKEYENWASYINNATGRGELTAGALGRDIDLEPAAGLLQSVFFSPRRIAATLRTMNPMYYARLYQESPVIAKKAMLDAVSYFGIVGTIAALTQASVGDDDDEFDAFYNPTSSDFLKIRSGKTRIDLFSGHQQAVVAMARLITGETTSSTSGRTTVLGEGYKPTTRLDVITRFFSNKFSPTISLAKKLLIGKDFKGDDINLEDELFGNTVPIWAQGLEELWDEHPAPVAFFMTMMTFMGSSMQTYDSKKPSDKKSKTSKKEEKDNKNKIPAHLQSLFN